MPQLLQPELLMPCNSTNSAVEAQNKSVSECSGGRQVKNHLRTVLALTLLALVFIGCTQNQTADVRIEVTGSASTARVWYSFKFSTPDVDMGVVSLPWSLSQTVTSDKLGIWACVQAYAVTSSGYTIKATVYKDGAVLDTSNTIIDTSGQSAFASGEVFF
jgi:hypothetical protein